MNSLLSKLAIIGALTGAGGFVLAAPVEPERLETLTPSGREAWSGYLARSAAAARADAEAIEAELRAHALTAPRRAPSGGDFKSSEEAAPAWYGAEEAGRLADAILSYQAPCGGWSKHTGYAEGPRRPGMLFTSQNEPGQRSHYLATFDNGATTSQIWFLARVWQATGREDCRAAVLRGLDYVIEAQYPNGGWPQVYPLEGGYHDDITLNDNALTNVLELLQAAAADAPDPAFAWIDAPRRERIARALDAGVACLLKLQVEQAGRKTVWCAQYDPLTLAPSSARKMEPAALSGMESVRVLRFLMSRRRPSLELVAAIEAGLAWFEQAKITDVAKRKVGGKTVYQVDPASTEVYWARFYDLESGRPIFPGRDGEVYQTHAEMIARNPGGYDYYTTQPGSLVRTAQKHWRKMLAGGK